MRGQNLALRGHLSAVSGLSPFVLDPFLFLYPCCFLFREIEFCRSTSLPPYSGLSLSISGFGQRLVEVGIWEKGRSPVFLSFPQGVLGV